MPPRRRTFGGVAEGNSRVRQLPWVEHAERGTGPLPWVDRPVHLDEPALGRRTGAQLGVVAGRHGVEPEPTARSSTAANLIFSLRRRHGFGVRRRRTQP